jgi:hypothetical protein
MTSMPRFLLAEDGAEIVAGMQTNLLHDAFLQFREVRTHHAERRFELAAIKRFNNLRVRDLTGTFTAAWIMLACSISAMILLTFAFSPRSYAGAMSAREARLKTHFAPLHLPRA